MHIFLEYGQTIRIIDGVVVTGLIRKFIVASPLPPTPEEVFRRLPGGFQRNLVAEVFRGRSGGGQEESGEGGQGGQEGFREEAWGGREEEARGGREAARAAAGRWPGGGRGGLQGALQGGVQGGFQGGAWRWPKCSK